MADIKLVRPAAKKAAAPKLSKTEIGNLITEYHTKRNERLKLDQESAKLEVQEKTILDQLVKAGVTDGVYGPYYVERNEKKVARVTDWPGFYAYIKQTGNLDMLTKHLTQSAIMARLDNAEYVPGVVTDDKISYKFTVA